MGVAESQAQVALQSEAKSLVGIEVHFRWDDSRLDLDYMGNAQAFDRFARVVDSIGMHMIDSVVIVSQSSPEGSYKHNMLLSQRRATTMRSAVEHRHPELKDMLRIYPDGESWMQLREYVEKDTVMERSTIDAVLSVIDSNVNINTKKWRMKQLPVYEYLYQTYYPRIRNSVFCIIYYDLKVTIAQIEEFVYTAVRPSPIPTVITQSFPIQWNRSEEYEPILNVRTNLLYDLGTVVNVGLEYYPRNPRWSVVGHYTFPWWSNDAKHRYLEVLDWNLEARYYLQPDKRHAGWYVAPYVHWNLYDISIEAEQGWQGEGKGCGLGIGYVWQPWNNKRWKLEAFARIGYYQTLFDPYHASDPFNDKYYYDWEGMPEDFIPRNYRLQMFGPTGAGITISYDLFKRKIKN